MAGLNVDITADTRQFQKETDNVPVALQKISDELNDVTKAGDKTGESLESNMRAAQTASEQTSQVFREQTNTVVSGYQKQEDAALLSNREINSIQREGIKTTGAALTQTVAQSAEAFDGTVNGAVNAVTNIATGVAALSSNAILAAGAGGVALLASLVAGAVQGEQEQTKEFKQNVSDLTTELEKLGTGGAGSVSAINDKLKEFSTTTDGSDKDLDHLKTTAEQAGVSWTSYARAIAGSTEDQQKLYDAASKMIPQLEQQIKLAEADPAGKNRASQEKQLDGLIQVTKALKSQNDLLGTAKNRVDELADAENQQGVATEAAAQAQQDYATTTLATFDDIGSQIAAKQAQISQTAQSESEKTKKKVVADNVETVQSFIDAQNLELKTLESNNASKIQIYEKFGDQAASVIKSAGDNGVSLKSFADAKPADVAKILANYAQLGKDAAQNLSQSAQDGLSGANLVLPAPIPPSTAALHGVAAQYVNVLQSYINSHPVQVPLVTNPHFGRNIQ